MADVQTTDINTKPTVTAIDSNDQIYISDGGTALKKISYTNLAKAIIEQYNASQLAGATKTIQTAINDLNSKTVKNNAVILNNTHDLNDYKGVDKAGFYYLQEGVANAPTNWIWMEVINGSGTIQICYTANRCWQRAYTGSPLAWTEWVSMPYRDEITALNSKYYANRNSLQTYSFTIKRGSTGDFWFALMYIGTGPSTDGIGIYEIHIDTSNNVVIMRIAGGNNRTFTGTLSDNTLTITASTIVYGGIRVLMPDI